MFFCFCHPTPSVPNPWQIPHFYLYYAHTQPFNVRVVDFANIHSIPFLPQ